MAINGGWVVQDRSGNVLAPSQSLGNFWSGYWDTSDSCEEPFDPRVLYDSQTDRWITVAIRGKSACVSRSAMLIAVSTSGDPLGTWYRAAFDADPDDTLWADRPTLGFSQDHVVIGANMFLNNAYQRSKVWALERPVNATSVKWVWNSLDPAKYAFTLVPATTIDAGVSTTYLASHWNEPQGKIALYTLTGTLGSPPCLSDGPVAHPQAAQAAPWSFDAATTNPAPQFGSSEGINNGDARMQGLVLRNGQLWATHHVFRPAYDPTRTSIQWWNLETDGTVIQQGLIDDSTGTLFRAYPSISVNAANDVLIGYSSFSDDQYASANYSLRLGSDPPGTFRNSTVLKGGEGPYELYDPEGRNRWGDYSSTHVDPVDDTHFWTIQEFARPPTVLNYGRWALWWGRVDPADAVPLPVNDYLADGAALPGDSGSVGGTNVYASWESGEASGSCVADTSTASVWWAWTPSADGSAQIDTNGSSFDTTLAVYTGDTVGGLVEVHGGCDDDGGDGAQSLVAVTVDGGTTYRIRVDGYNVATGEITLNYNLTTTPAAVPDDIAFYYPGNGYWYIQGQSPVGYSVPTDTAGIIPTPADYDGDGDDDIAFYYPGNGYWYAQGQSPVGYSVTADPAGIIPTPADYDGDGDDDIAFYYPGNGYWYIQGQSPVGYSVPTDTTGIIPVPGDYDGDGDDDIAFYWPQNGYWYIQGQSPVGYSATTDTTGIIPVPGDYDGDGDDDIAFYWPQNGYWYAQGQSPVGYSVTADPTGIIPTPQTRTMRDGHPSVTVTEEAIYEADDAQEGDLFGAAVDADGGVVVVGAPGDDGDSPVSGAAYVYAREKIAPGGPSDWVERQRLTPPGASGPDYLGRSVAISGDAIIAGAPGAGAAYIFRWHNPSWTEEDTLESPASSDDFGLIVDISGNLAVVGAPTDDEAGLNAGAVYVYTAVSGSWLQASKLLPDEGSVQERFGRSLATDGNTILVGSNDGTYVYRLESGTWRLKQELPLVPYGASAGCCTGSFGRGLAVEGDRLAIGHGGESVGMVSLYTFDEPGQMWIAEQTVGPPDGLFGDHFGNAVALNGNALAAGAYGHDALGDFAGATYLFLRSDEMPAGSEWQFRSKITASDASARSYFGESVAIDGGVLVIGAHGANIQARPSKAYIYRIDPSE